MLVLSLLLNISVFSVYTKLETDSVTLLLLLSFIKFHLYQALLNNDIYHHNNLATLSYHFYHH